MSPRVRSSSPSVCAPRSRRRRRAATPPVLVVVRARTLSGRQVVDVHRRASEPTARITSIRPSRFSAVKTLTVAMPPLSRLRAREATVSIATVEPKPSGWDRRYAEWFDDSSVVETYRYRPIPGRALHAPRLPGRALRSGARRGMRPGDIARPLAPLVGRVDAVDLSPRMVSEGRRRAGGDASNLAWLVGPIEDVPLCGPYDLVVAGDSVHWFDWQAVIPRFAKVLGPDGRLAIVSSNWLHGPGAPAPPRPGLRPLQRESGTSGRSPRSPSSRDEACSHAPESTRPLRPGGAPPSTRSSAAIHPLDRTASTRNECARTRSLPSTTGSRMSCARSFGTGRSPNARAGSSST